MTKSPHVRWMVSRDRTDVLMIDAASFDQPWAEETFRDALRDRNCIGMVAVDERVFGDTVLGYMVYELRPREIEVLRFAVAPDRRWAGVGRAMAAKLAGKLSAERRTRIVLHARESNVSGCKFWARCGYRATTLVRGHYPDTGEDGIRMEYAVGVPALAR